MALTAAQIERREANREYWRKREREQRELYMLEEAEQEKELRRIYAEMEEWCTAEVERFYGKYANAEGIDITEAKRRVAKEDVEAFEAQAKKYVEEKDFSPQANAEMRLYNATMRINRLELLKAQIGLHTVGGFDEIQAYYDEKITDRTMDELERQAGLLGRPIKEQDVVKRAKNIVNASFYNATFSERIWAQMDNLRQSIATELQKGLIAGVGSREMARRIKEYSYDKSLSDAHRLMVTELRRVQTDVALDSYKAQGIEQYEFMAVNPNACEICKDMDGNIYNVSDLEAGVNAPPIHPRCHCTTAPHIDEDEYEMWLTWLENGGTSEQWDAMSDAEKRENYSRLKKDVGANSDSVVKSSSNGTNIASLEREPMTAEDSGQFMIPDVVYHGGGEIDSINGGQFFTTSSKDLALDYAGSGGHHLTEIEIDKDSRVKVIEADGNSWRDMSGEYTDDSGNVYYAGDDPLRDIARKAREDGYDVLIVKNVVDPSAVSATTSRYSDEDAKVDEFIVLNPKKARIVKTEAVDENFKHDLSSWVEFASPFPLSKDKLAEYEGMSIDDYDGVPLDKIEDVRIRRAVERYRQLTS